MIIELNSLKETEKFGFAIAKLLKPNDIICLQGTLGAGKTTLVQSIGKGLGVNDYITSPTFTLINEYEGNLPVYHFDLYRLENIDDIFDLGFEEYFYSGGVCMIEWAERIKDVLPKSWILIKLDRSDDENKRILTIEGEGERTIEILKGIENYVNSGD